MSTTTTDGQISREASSSSLLWYMYMLLLTLLWQLCEARYGVSLVVCKWSCGARQQAGW
jgi:hypothetical protein